MKKILLFLLGLSNSVLAQTTIFSQDFSSSAVVADYVSATPNSGQFTAIGTSNTGSSVAIQSGSLAFVRPGSATSVGSFTRNITFSPIPQVIFYKMNISVSGVSEAVTTAASFFVGSGFTNGNSEPSPVSSVHSRFGMNFLANGSYIFRQLGTGSVIGANSYSGTSSITWVVNNSSSSYTYSPPGGGPNETVAADSWDLYVGTVRELNDIPATTSSQDLSNIKFTYTSTTAGTIAIDDILIESVTPLPIQLSSFNTQAIDKTILLNWETLSETNNAFFEIERSIDGKTFTKIGSKDGSGTTTALTKYRFVDESPVPGTNYYRLKQIDFDGKSETSAIKSAISNIPFATLSVLQGANSVTAQVLSPVKEKSKLSLFDISGKVLAQQEILIEKGLNQFDFNQNLVSGVYFFKLTSASSQINTKFVKP